LGKEKWLRPAPFAPSGAQRKNGNILHELETSEVAGIVKVRGIFGSARPGVPLRG